MNKLLTIIAAAVLIAAGQRAFAQCADTAGHVPAGRAGWTSVYEYYRDSIYRINNPQGKLDAI